MITRLGFGLLVLLAVLFAAPEAFAQEDTDDEDAEDASDETGEDQDSDEDASEETDAEEDDDEADDEGDLDEGDSDDEDDLDDEDEVSSDMDLKPPQALDLDMGGLEDMDPAEDLGDEGFLSEDEAGSQAVEDWTERDLEVLELHGYFRVRPELYHKFYMRNDNAVFNQPMEEQVTDGTGGSADALLGNDCRESGSRRQCHNPTLAGANMRLRVEPTLNISEEVWIKSQVDFLDNVMLGSSPYEYQNYGSGSDEMIRVSSVQGHTIGPATTTDDAVAGDMIAVRRAWGEVLTPLGRLSFGRMPSHWGLGMLYNSGDGIDQDFGDTVDRLMFAAKINNWLIAPAFDFPNEGVSMDSAAGRPLDMAQLDDAYRLVGMISYKHDEEDQRAMIRRGDWVVNAGLHFAYRSQVLSFQEREENPDGSYDVDPREEGALPSYHFYRRDMWSITPDLWFQLLVGTFHLEIEVALIYGEVGNPDDDLSNFDDASALTLAQWGGVIQADFGLLSDQLRIGLEFGFASGDDDVEGINAPYTFDQTSSNKHFNPFSFNPAYNVDLIMFHHIVGSVSQSYYFNPWLRYDFLKSAMGKQLGIQFDVIYSRAVFSESTISGDSGNLGVELDAQVMYISSDNFHAALKYGVLFPLGAFKGTYEDEAGNSFTDNDLTIPQTFQLLLGISF